jgi:predicted kinase
MATLHLVCGLPCSGKTTLALQLEREHSALRLTPDEWHTALFGQDVEDERHDERHDLIEAMLWKAAARVLELGVDVVLDFGFWSRSERADYRARAASLGAGTRLHYLDVPEAELLNRLQVRNDELPPGAFKIEREQLKVWVRQFQPPADEEFEGST